MGVSAATEVRTRAPLWKTQVETRAEWKAKPVFHFCTASRARVVPICPVGGSDSTRSWPRWPEHTRAPFDVQLWPLRAPLPLPGGCCSRGLPWSPPEVPELPGPPPCPSRLNSAQLPTQGRPPQPGATKSQLRANWSWACGQEAFITTWTDTAVRDRPSPPGHWGRSCVDSPPASQGADSVTQEKTGEPSNEAHDLGCLLYKPKEMYT